MKLEALQKRRHLIFEHFGYKRLKSLLSYTKVSHSFFCIQYFFTSLVYQYLFVCYPETEGYVLSWKMVTLVDNRERE